jgi:hypothetical protein
MENNLKSSAFGLRRNAGNCYVRLRGVKAARVVAPRFKSSTVASRLYHKVDPFLKTLNIIVFWLGREGVRFCRQVRITTFQKQIRKI